MFIFIVIDVIDLVGICIVIIYVNDYGFVIYLENNYGFVIYLVKMIIDMILI